MTVIRYTLLFLLVFSSSALSQQYPILLKDLTNNVTTRSAATLSKTGALQDIRDITPDADDTYDLGSASLSWKDLYYGGTIKSIDTSNGMKITVGNDATQGLGWTSPGTVYLQGDNVVGLNVNGLGIASADSDSFDVGRTLRVGNTGGSAGQPDVGISGGATGPGKGSTIEFTTSDPGAFLSLTTVKPTGHDSHDVFRFSGATDPDEGTSAQGQSVSSVYITTAGPSIPDGAALGFGGADDKTGETYVGESGFHFLAIESFTDGDVRDSLRFMGPADPDTGASITMAELTTAQFRLPSGHLFINEGTLGVQYAVGNDENDGLYGNGSEVSIVVQGLDRLEAAEQYFDFNNMVALVKKASVVNRPALRLSVDQAALPDVVPTIVFLGNLGSAGNVGANSSIGPFATGANSADGLRFAGSSSPAEPISEEHQSVTMAEMTTHGFAWTQLAADPASPREGDCWYNTTDNIHRCRDDVATIDIQPPGGGVASFQDLYDADVSDAVFDLDATGSLVIRNSASAPIFDVDEAGTVDVTGTLTVAGNIMPEADGTRSLGAAATEFGTLWAQTIDDGDGIVAVAAALTVAGNVTVTGDVLPEADGTRSLGASATEFGTVWTQVLDDSDGTVAVNAALSVGGHVTPQSADTYTIGASDNEFATAWVNTIDDNDGTVSVAANLSLAGNLTPDADNSRNIGASTNEFATAWIQTIDDNDGTVNIDAALSIGGSVTLQAADSYSIGAANTELGTLWVNTIDDNDGTVAIDATLRAQSISAAADNTYAIGASGTEFTVGWFQSIDDGDGTVNIDAAVSLGGSVTLQAADTYNIGASNTELNTLWVNTIDDNDGTVSINAALFMGGSITLQSADTYTIGTNGTELGQLWVNLIGDGDGLLTINNAAQIGGSFTPVPADTHSLGASGNEWLVVWANSLDDADGTVNIDAAVSLGGSISLQAADTYNIGASGTELNTLWVNTIDDNDGTVAVAADLTVNGVNVGNALDLHIPAADFFVTESASGTNWVTDTFGGIAADSTNDGETVLLLDDTTAEGAGFEFSTPAAVTDIYLSFWGRPEVAPGGAVGARLTVTCRDMTAGSATSSWGTAQAVGAFSFGADEDWEQLSVTITAANLGIAANSWVQCEFAREPTHGTDTLTGDLVIRGMRVGVR